MPVTPSSPPRAAASGPTDVERFAAALKDSARADREKAANWKLQHLSLRKATAAGDKAPGELSRDVDILRAAFERWFAHIDKSAEAGVIGRAAGKPSPAP